jgi:RimJ/RimL family protein N-acetyltransferase
MTISVTVPPVVPAGRLAAHAQPVIDLAGGLRLRPWDPTDADALVATAADPEIRRWNLLSVPTPDDARARIQRMHERWQAKRPRGGPSPNPGQALPSG